MSCPKKIIKAPLNSDFIVVADASKKDDLKFVFADSSLLEALEPLMENPVANLKAFANVCSNLDAMCSDPDDAAQTKQTMQLVLNLMLELREFDIRASEFLSNNNLHY